MNLDLSKFEPPKAEPDGHTKELFGMPRITCAACGVFMERPDVSEKTELENEVDILNSYEKLRYQVDKSKEV